MDDSRPTKFVSEEAGFECDAALRKATADLFDAAMSGNIKGLQLALAQGADINSVNESNDNALVVAICSCDDDLLKSMIRYLLDHGANPNSQCAENTGALFQAVIRMDIIAIKLLLERGADANVMLADRESLYDWSEFTYRYHAFDSGLGIELPLTPTDTDEESEESWLRFLDRCAAVAGVFPPTFLWLLRQHGAKTAHELNRSAPT